MGHLSAGYACLHCPDIAPTVGENSRFVYLTNDGRSPELEPSCRQHAVYETRPDGTLVVIQPALLPLSTKAA